MNTEINMKWLNWGPFVGKFDLDKTIIERLHKDGKKKLKSYHKKLAGHVKREVKIGYDDLWINFMQPGDFNPVHTHNGDYSFVVFVDIPKSLKKEQDTFEGTSAVPGALQFEYGVQARPPWATTGHAIIPETGQMIMFPALMQHWVVPYKTNCTRVTVSGNLRIMNRHELPPNYF